MTSNMTNSEFSPGFLGIVVLLVTVQRDKNENTGAIMTPVPQLRRQLRRLQVNGGGLAAAPVGFDVERYLLAFDQRAHAGALDGGDVNEHIGAAGVLDDEAVAFLGVEELNGTLSHYGPPVETHHAFCAVQTIRTAFNPDFAWSWERPVSAGETARQAKSRMPPT
jgi:hypothetical protein